MIKVTHLKDQGIFTFTLPYTSSKYRVNGSDVMGGAMMTTKTEPTIELLNHETIITHYVNAEGILKDIENYKKEYEELASKGVYDEEEGELQFSDLDDEYAYRNFLRKWTAVTITEQMAVRLETIVQHAMLDTGCPYLTSMFSLDTNKADLVVFHKGKLEIDTVRTWAAENNIQIDIPTHGHLRFAKINDKYAFNDEFNNGGDRVMTYEQGELALKETKDRILRHIRATQIDIRDLEMKVSTLISRLETIQKECYTQGNSRSTSRERAFNTITKMIGDLTKDVKNFV